ncbi:hypothetical protein JANAI62_26910 [Jannaschia pagri]|uniref:Uncharacterized protein n=1 Tax=Jannaschia pagri TaxID=2829797 RepID=A0ABQ4NNS8_9RHOB|nr:MULTISPECIES: hypothetical protein [unclassified Jannaschia]GIT92234.1 hypothetical protein JANAI61_26920 [Jannaschia sp. AI_61]GIT96068.1 hypothetical protein JANAI62_26910 [Jannaschia sp. AI_62]
MAKEGRSADDPKALIHEAYRIDGISLAECRSIFLDWALSLTERKATEAIPRLLAAHGAPDHPMTQVLNEGLTAPAQTGRRGGRAARVGTPD